ATPSGTWLAAFHRKRKTGGNGSSVAARDVVARCRRGCRGASVGLSVDREAVEQAGAAGAFQVGLAAAAAAVRRAPRARRRALVEAVAVVVAELGGALSVAGPVAAGGVVAGREAAAVRGRACQHVVLVGIVADPVDLVAVLVERGVLVDVVGVAVQLVDV